jgi:hypothetical protein
LAALVAFAGFAAFAGLAAAADFAGLDAFTAILLVSFCVCLVLLQSLKSFAACASGCLKHFPVEVSVLS